MQELLTAALKYANQGWAVFPVHFAKDGKCSCGKECSSPAKHPVAYLVPHGVKDASKDPEIIKQWWSEFPYNIAIACGEVSGITVVDVDDGYKGSVPLPWGYLECITGSSKGKHYYFKYRPIKNKVKVNQDAIDVRNDGGYVLAPPSNHISGGTYEWVDPTAAMIAMPDKIYNALQDDEPKTTEIIAGQPILEGQRNQTLFAEGCALRGRGYSEDEIAVMLAQLNKRCQPPLNEKDITTIAHSASRYEAAMFGLDGAILGLQQEPKDLKRSLVVYKKWKDIPAIDTDWLWEDILPRGVLATLTMKWKEGKTTFVVSLAKALTAGQPFGRATRKSKIVMVSEEPNGIWYWRGLDLDVPDDGSFHILTQQANHYSPTWANWNGMFDDLAEYCQTEHIDLVLLDTLFSFAPWEDENSSIETRNGMIAPRKLANSGPAVVLLHHPAKGTGEARGSGAIVSSTDINLTLAPTGKLEWMGRFGRGWCQFAFDDESQLYKYAGVIDPVEERQSQIVSVIEASQEPLLAIDINVALGAKVGLKTIRNDCETLVRNKRIRKMPLDGKTYGYARIGQ